MLGRKTFAPKLVHDVNLEERVPPDHLLRRIAEVVDFSFVRRLTARFYSPTGQPGIDPEVLFKMALVGYLYGITSERRLAEELRLHLAYMWFVGYDLDECCPTAAARTLVRPDDGGLRERTLAHLRTPRARRHRRRRSCWIETANAELKERHGLRRAQCRGRDKVLMQAVGAALAYNLKKLARLARPQPASAALALAVPLLQTTPCSPPGPIRARRPPALRVRATASSASAVLMHAVPGVAQASSATGSW